MHRCHWPPCDEVVPDKHWACVRHWKSLPAELRTLIWKTYTPGQESSGKMSPLYMETHARVLKWIHEHGWRLT